MLNQNRRKHYRANRNLHPRYGSEETSQLSEWFKSPSTRGNERYISRYFHPVRPWEVRADSTKTQIRHQDWLMVVATQSLASNKAARTKEDSGAKRHHSFHYWRSLSGTNWGLL